MRRLYWALPFLAYLMAYLFWMFTPSALIVTAFSWTVFFIEYRYGENQRRGKNWWP